MSGRAGAVGGGLGWRTARHMTIVAGWHGRGYPCHRGTLTLLKEGGSVFSLGIFTSSWGTLTPLNISLFVSLLSRCYCTCHYLTD